MERDGLPFPDAWPRSRKTAAFTTHTPVPAGNRDLRASLVQAYAEAWGAGLPPPPPPPFVDLGRATAGDGAFNMTVLAIRTSSRINGVSKLHGRVADAMWKHLFPPGETEKERIGSITNGVHIPTWMGPEMGAVLRRRLGDDFSRRLLDPAFADEVLAVPDEEIWSAHTRAEGPAAPLRAASACSSSSRGTARSPEDLRRVQSLMAPEVLTLGLRATVRDLQEGRSHLPRPGPPDRGS